MAVSSGCVMEIKVIMCSVLDDCECGRSISTVGLFVRF